MKKLPSADELAKLAREAIHAKIAREEKEIYLKNNPSYTMLKQAEYFLEKIKENYQNDPECKYYLWAFVWSARAVIDYLMKYYGLTKKEWISIKELKFLDKIRNLSIHRRPLPTERTATVRLAQTVDLLGPGEEPPAQPATLESPEKIKDSKQIPSKPKIMGWDFLISYKPADEQTKFKFPAGWDTDVLKFCKRVLERVTEIFEECESRNE